MNSVSQTLSTTVPQSPSSSRRRWFELFLVVFVSCGTPFLNSLYVFLKGAGPILQYPHFRWTLGIIHESASLLLLAYVMSRRDLRLANLGFRWSVRDFFLGFPIALAAYVTYAIAFRLVLFIHHTVFASPPVLWNARIFFGHPSFAFVPYILLSPFFEELIVRAFVMTELIELTGSSALAVAASVLIQSSYHLYYGWIGTISVAFMFLTFSLAYWKVRRVLPVISAHALIDIYGALHII
jgi:membrane protease YdiL (CAAX protease family)